MALVPLMLALSFSSVETLRPLRPGELSKLFLWDDLPYGIAQGANPGDVRFKRRVQLLNNTRLELESVMLRLVF